MLMGKRTVYRLKRFPAKTRGRVVMMVPGSMLPILLTAAVALAQSSDEWPQFRGNPALTGVTTATVPAQLKLLWTFEAGDSIESSAAIANGVVFVGCQSGHLLAVDLQTGKLKWKYKTEQGVGESSPAVHDGIVYVGDLSGMVHAVAADSGKRVWTFQTGTEIKSSPVVAAGRVLIGSYDGTLYALGPRDG